MMFKIIILSPILLPIVLLALVLVAICSPLILLYAMYDRHKTHIERMRGPRTNILNSLQTPIFDEIQRKKKAN